MKIKLQNIGIIEEADINIDGITLIAGQNDSGKSTVGKVLYAFIKGFNQDINHFQEEKNGMISYYYQDILKEFKKNWNEDISEFQTKEINNEWFLKIEEIIARDSLPEEIKKPLNDKIYFLKNHYNKEYNSIVQKKEETRRWFNSEIKTLHSLYKSEKATKIEIEDLEGNVTISSWHVDLENYYLELDNNLETYYKEAYYIESPLIVDESLQRFIGKDNFQIFKRNRQQELAKSLSNPMESGILDYSNIYNKISEIINGEITVDLLQGVQYKKSSQNIAIKNTALGIKSFGIIQLLLKNNRLNNRSLLIIDEPEVHLHPTWQVKYAETLVALSKEFDIPMVLTSHSPYFIEALEAFSKKYKYEKSTNFYYTEKNENGLSSKIVNVNNSLSKIYSSISEASYQLRHIENNE